MTSICKQCRQASKKLFLKGERCFSSKCAMVKRPYAPGFHKKARRGSSSEYGRQLSAKQGLKRVFGIREKQFANYVEEAIRRKGDARENLINILERRLDNVVFRSGLAKSRPAARQLVSHGNVLVKGRRVNIASYQVKNGQAITLKEKIKKSKLMENLSAVLKKYNPPAWIALDREKVEVKVASAPTVDDFNLSEIGMIIEFYSR